MGQCRTSWPKRKSLTANNAFLTSAPKHTKAERLLTDDLLASAEADLPTKLPSPFPDSPTAEQTALAKVHAIAADIRAVAIEISQRRSFQLRYTEDLQAALNLGDPTSPAGPRGPPITAKFVPPPGYDKAPPSPMPSAGGGKEIDETRHRPVSARLQSPAYGDTLGVPGSPGSPSGSRTHSHQSSTERRYAALPPVPFDEGGLGVKTFISGFAPPRSPRSPVGSGGGFGSMPGAGPGLNGWSPLRVPQRSSTPTRARTGTPAGGHRSTQSARQLSVPGPSSIPARPVSPS
ncbi:hypothetical protein FS749_004058 [Ceratobasidium sp. UAMH 11750]|nr:hypothetical protein FS749_004058 [Ceratobasidium sp. UAMH 11750]